MIKIFSTENDKAAINAWRETNSLGVIEFGTVEEGTILSLSDFPAIVSLNGSSIAKVYAQGMTDFMNISLEDIAEIKSKM